MCAPAPALTALSLHFRVWPGLLLTRHTAGSAGVCPPLSALQAGTGFQTSTPVITQLCRLASLSLSLLICKIQTVIPRGNEQADANRWPRVWPGAGARDTVAVLSVSIPHSRDRDKTNQQPACWSQKMSVV